MNSDYRKRLLAILAALDQMSAEAEAIMAEPADAENLALAEELHELHAVMRAKIEAKLERAEK